MARILDRMPRKPTAKYPWDEWLDGQVRELAHGDDYNGKSSTFSQNARYQAQRRGGKAVVQVYRNATGGERIALQFRKTGAA